MGENDGRRGRPWRRLRAQVLREEPWCYVCGEPATQVDHYWPLSQFPHLAMERSNLRSICRHHNLSQGDRLPTQVRRRPPPPPETTSLTW